MTSKYSVGERVYYDNLTHGRRYGVVESIESERSSRGVQNKIWAYWGDAAIARWMYESEVFQDPNDKVIPYDPNQIGDTDDDL